ncbi:MAG TPA: helix-turn-helix transcriptional regulator [Solirubrobacteraceae bacterium]|nr:helix-turn-helix transcriptional regulator [Solirubrobacteraceae bacterium]
METTARSAQPLQLQPSIDAAGAEPECHDTAGGPSLRGVACSSVLDCPLSPRQHEVVTTLMCGLTYKQAASKLGISPSTVRTHVHAAYERLAVTNLSQACVLMIRQGWTDPSELLPDYRGAPYTTRTKRGQKDWLPSPAQRLYLDAFDRLLRDRDDVAVALVDYYFGAMTRERSVPDRRRAASDVDAMLLGIARGVLRPIAAHDLAA